MNIKYVIITILILFYILDLSCKEKTIIKNKNMNNEKKAVYILNDKKVSEETFSKFFKSLKEIPGTWYCAETTNGGITGFDMTDKKNTVFEYLVKSEDGNSTSIIRKKNILK